MQYFTIPGIVYLLCAATCLACSALLGRGYMKGRVPLLFWSSLCFFGLAIDNALLYIDRIIVPHVEMDHLRRIPGLIALMLLVWGLVVGDDQR